MEDALKGSQLLSESVPEVGEDAVTTVTPPPPSPSPPAMTEEEREELQQELAKVEEEIQTLTQVLADKEKQVVDMKRRLGITALNELKQNITKTWQGVTTSTAYKLTSETFSQAGLKATAALSTVGSAIGRKLEDVRNAPTFKSLEEKVETLKTKMTPSVGNQDDQDDGSVDAPSDRQEAPPTEETPTH